MCLVINTPTHECIKHTHKHTQASAHTIYSNLLEENSKSNSRWMPSCVSLLLLVPDFTLFPSDLKDL